MLILYIVLVVTIAIWGSKKEALVFLFIGVAGFFGSVILVPLGLPPRAGGYIYSTYLAIGAVVMVFRIWMRKHFSAANISSFKSSKPYSYTPLDAEGNDPRLLSKYSVDGPDPRKK